MTDERLAELKGMCEAPHLHPGPWHDDGGYRVYAPATAAEQESGLGAEVVLCECKILHGTPADNALMAAARDAVPELVAECERLRAANARLAAGDARDDDPLPGPPMNAAGFAELVARAQASSALVQSFAVRLAGAEVAVSFTPDERAAVLGSLGFGFAAAAEEGGAA